MSKNELLKRILLVVVGQIILGLGVAMFIYAKLGVDPVGVFHTGIANIFNISFGLALFFESIVFLIIVYFVDKSFINIGTIISLFGVSVSSELFLKILSILIPNLDNIVFRFVLFVISMFVLATGLNIYILAGLGINPIDAIPEIINKKVSLDYKYIRIIYDVTFLTSGIILGGQFGIGTLIAAFVLGPIIGFIRNLIKDPLNNFAS